VTVLHLAKKITGDLAFFDTGLNCYFGTCSLLTSTLSAFEVLSHNALDKSTYLLTSVGLAGWHGDSINRASDLVIYRSQRV